MGRAERRRAQRLGLRESWLDQPTMDWWSSRNLIGRSINRGTPRMKLALGLAVLAVLLLPFVAVGLSMLWSAVF